MAERMLGELLTAVRGQFDFSATSVNVVRLPSIHVGKLKYGYSDAFGYNKCKLDSTLGGAFMARCMKGEIKV